MDAADIGLAVEVCPDHLEIARVRLDGKDPRIGQEARAEEGEAADISPSVDDVEALARCQQGETVQPGVLPSENETVDEATVASFEPYAQMIAETAEREADDLLASEHTVLIAVIEEPETIATARKAEEGAVAPDPPDIASDTPQSRFQIKQARCTPLCLSRLSPV